MAQVNFGPSLTPNASSVNFFQQSPETAVDVNALQRQRAMAQLLAQRGIQAPEGQMVSGQYVAPAALSYASQLASALAGGKLNRDADTKEQQLAQAMLDKRQKDASDFMGALNGSPAQAGRTVQPLTPNDDEGNPMPTAQTPATAAVPGDVNKAIAIALQSQNPQLAGMAPELMKRQMDAAELQNALQSASIGSSGGQTAGAPTAGGATGGGTFLAPPSGGIPGVDPRAMALTLSRNAQANKLGAMIQEANKPMAIAEGGTAYVPGQGAVFTAPKTEAGINVQGGQAAPVAGFAEAQARREGLQAQARQAAESANTMVTVDVGGKPTQMTRAQFLQLSGGGNAGPVNGQRVPNPLAARPGEDDRAMIYTQERRNLQDNLQQAQASKDPAQIARAQADVDALEKEIVSNKVRMPQNSVPGIVGQSESEKRYATTRADDFAKRASAIQTAGTSSAGMLRNLDTLEGLFKDPNVAKGGAAESISGLKNTAASMGVDIKGVGSEQAIQAITNKMALDSRSTAEGGGMPGAMSDADRTFLSNQQPGLNKTPEGRALIIDNARKLAQRQIEVARMAQKYEQEHGQIDAGFDRQLQEFADKTPMFANKKQASAPQAQDFRALAAQELARRQKGGS